MTKPGEAVEEGSEVGGVRERHFLFPAGIQC